MKHWRETTEIVQRILALAAAGRHAALATVIRIEGSSYRRPGAKFLIEDDGQTLGGVSGGCLEADVHEVALQVLQTSAPKLLHYDTGTDDSTVWGLGLGCNGSVDIFVQPATTASTRDVLRQLSARLAEREPIEISTIVDGPTDVGHMTIRDAVSRGTGSRVTAEGDRTVFTEVLQPPPTLIVCGAGDDARPLVALASETGFAVTVVDHRHSFLAADRFPSARLVQMRPDGDVDSLRIDARTLVVVKTHSFKHDRDWVERVLESRASYIGLLGPRARAEEILADLNAGADPRIFAPVGLSLGADGPEQIAVSVIAELLAVLSRQAPVHLREKGHAIHAF
jgi:xanthine/CO dehydrogenase XdhC/CoxF family maturation factor